MKRAVFLDRDGVLNAAVMRDGKPYPPASAAVIEIVTVFRDAVAQLGAACFVRIVVTNQPDIARGTTTREQVDAIHARLQAELPLDAIYVCPHDDADKCICRKPLPGMLFQAAAEHGLRLTHSFMVGDRWRDIEAGRAAGGCRTVFVDRGYSEQRPEQPDATVAGLLEAAAWILSYEP
jgi:D-glycero-D-manno-heptose 1,7-bisphosphate phosphatase